MSMELLRGSIYEVKTITGVVKTFILVKDGEKKSLLLEMFECDDPQSLSDFTCTFFCKKLSKLFEFHPQFILMTNQRIAISKPKIIAQLTDRELSAIMIAISNLIIPDFAKKRLFLCEDGGESHEKGFWTDVDNMREFVEFYDRNGVKLTSEKYNLSNKTVWSYQFRFKKCLGTEVRQKAIPRYWHDTENMERFLDEIDENGEEWVAKQYSIAKSTVRIYQREFMKSLGMDVPYSPHSHPMANRGIFGNPERMLQFLVDSYELGVQRTATMYSIKPRTVYSYRLIMRKRLKELGMEELIPV